jgi:hypothetical protein
MTDDMITIEGLGGDSGSTRVNYKSHPLRGITKIVAEVTANSHWSAEVGIELFSLHAKFFRGEFHGKLDSATRELLRVYPPEVLLELAGEITKIAGENTE